MSSAVYHSFRYDQQKVENRRCKKFQVQCWHALALALMKKHPKKCSHLLQKCSNLIFSAIYRADFRHCYTEKLSPKMPWRSPRQGIFLSSSGMLELSTKDHLHCLVFEKRNGIDTGDVIRPRYCHVVDLADSFSASSGVRSFVLEISAAARCSSNSDGICAFGRMPGRGRL